MKIEEFKLERTLSRFQNEVHYDLSASGIYPMFISEILDEEEMMEIYRNLQLRYVHTAGTMHFREAVSTFYDGMDPSNVFITNGASESLFMVAWQMVEPGDEVAFMVPNFMAIAQIVEANGARVRYFNLDPSKGWSLDIESLKKAVTPKTKLICVCNPNNPTGTILDDGQMKEIVDIADSVGAYIVSDEVYRGTERSGEVCTSFWGLYDKVIVVGGLSKAFALPGLRVGWIAGPREMIDQAWSYHDFLTVTIGTFSDHLGTRALQPEMREKIFQRNRRIATQNMSIFSEWVKSHEGVLSFTPPQAGCFAFPDFSLPVNSWDLVMDMVHNNSVFVVPGSCFGIENHLRMNFGVERNYLIQGLERIDLTINKFKQPISSVTF